MTGWSLLLVLLLQSAGHSDMPEFPADPGVYYLGSAASWVKLQPASIDTIKTKGMELFIETGGYTSLGMNVTCSGGKAALRINVLKPTFYVRASGASKDAMLVRLAQKKTVRTVHTSSANSSVDNKSGFDKRDIRKIAIAEYPDHSFSLTPEQNLSPGEYLLVFGSAASGFDFGVDRKK
jgi:hypothetical protein